MPKNSRPTLTPADLLLLRLLRIKGAKADTLARCSRISEPTVWAQTTKLGIVPSTSDEQRALQLGLARQLFARESGLLLAGETGDRLWEAILADVLRRAIPPDKADLA